MKAKNIILTILTLLTISSVFAATSIVENTEELNYTKVFKTDDNQIMGTCTNFCSYCLMINGHGSCNTSGDCC